MTGIGRRLVLVLTIGCFQNGALLAQSPGIGHKRVAGAEVGTNGLVSASAVFDDGSGPALYIGGEFTSVNGTPANRIARWDGRNWSAVGPGITGRVHAMTVFDDGGGPALYVAGNFTGDVRTNNIARWDGNSWSAVGSAPGRKF